VAVKLARAERGATFAEADSDPGLHAAIDASYRAEYDRFGPAFPEPSSGTRPPR
jgi:hypothetical protein